MRLNIGFILLCLLVVGLVSASSVSVWQGQYYTGTTFNTGTYTFNFTVYDALSGGNVCFTNTTNLTTGNWGEWRTEQSPWSGCNNASEEYFLNINIAGTNETPRRRLTVSDFLRRDVSEIQEGNLVVGDNISATYFLGDGSYLIGVNEGGDINSVQGDNIYIYNGSNSGNVLLVFNETKLNGTIDLRAIGISWAEAINGTLAELSTILGFGYYNSSSFIISDYYFKSNPFGFWNDTYATFNETYADTKYLQSFTEVDPLWTGNSTNVGYLDTANVFTENQTVEGIILEGDTANHRIYDNATCVIITGDTSTMYIC